MSHRSLHLIIIAIITIMVTFGCTINQKPRPSIDPDVDEAMYALIEDLVYSQQVSKLGWAKGVGKASRAKPRYNLTGDPYFTFGLRAVLVFERRPVSLSWQRLLILTLAKL